MYLASNRTNVPLFRDERVNRHPLSSLMTKMNGRLKRSLIQNCVIANCGIRSAGLDTPYQRTLGSQRQIWPMLQISSNNFTLATHPNLLIKPFQNSSSFYFFNLQYLYHYLLHILSIHIPI